MEAEPALLILLQRYRKALRPHSAQFTDGKRRFHRELPFAFRVDNQDCFPLRHCQKSALQGNKMPAVQAVPVRFGLDRASADFRAVRLQDSDVIPASGFITGCSAFVLPAFKAAFHGGDVPVLQDPESQGAGFRRKLFPPVRILRCRQRPVPTDFAALSAL